MPSILCWHLKDDAKAMLDITPGALVQIKARAPNYTSSHHILYCQTTTHCQLKKGQFHLRMAWWSGKN